VVATLLLTGPNGDGPVIGNYTYSTTATQDIALAATYKVPASLYPYYSAVKIVLTFPTLNGNEFDLFGVVLEEVPATLTITGDNYIAAVSGTTTFTTWPENTAGTTWSATGGTFSVNSGTGAVTYTAPATAGVYTITATRDTRTATQSVYVAQPIPLHWTAPNDPARTMPGGALTFTAKPTGATYSVLEGSAGGTINNSTGAYAAPATAGIYTIQAEKAAEIITRSVEVGAPITITGPTSPIQAVMGGTAQLTASEPGVIWTVASGPATATIGNNTGLFTAPATAGTYVIQARKDWRTSTANVIVLPVMTLTGPAWVLNSGTATGTYSTNATSATWSIVGDDGTKGSITEGGVYTAPALAGVNTITLRAASATDTRTATYNVVVAPAPAIDVPATVQTIDPGTTLQFGANEAGGTWSVVGGAANGAITAGGLYTAPLPVTQTTYTVQYAKDVRSATMTVIVRQALTIAGPGAVAPSGSGTFTASEADCTWSIVGDPGNGSMGTLTVASATTVTYAAPATSSTIVLRIAKDTRSATRSVAITDAVDYLAYGPTFTSAATGNLSTSTSGLT
jgi:hypothetical protein